MNAFLTWMQSLASSRSSARSSSNLCESVSFSNYFCDVFSFHAGNIWHVVRYIRVRSRLSTNFSVSKCQRVPQVMHVPQHPCSRGCGMTRNEQAELRNVTQKNLDALWKSHGMPGQYFGKQELVEPLRSSDQLPLFLQLLVVCQ